MKKPLIILIVFSSLSFFLVLGIFRNYLLFSSLQKDSQKYFNQVMSGETSDRDLAEKIIKNLEKINNKLNKIDIKQLNEFKSISNDLLLVSKKFLNENQNYIIILQNSDELRASGGFLGSFSTLEIKNGQPTPFKIQDIYVPDGQFKGFLEAPKGLDEYLSSGQGMRLPDSNWWPNFPDSAEQVLYFFKETEQKDYQGVIAINLNAVEKLLAITGEIYLPDYDKSVDQYNFAEIAREDRSEFFPGSQEKANFLNHFLKIFKLKLSQSIKENPKAYLALAKNLLQSKDIQIYSKDQEIAEILSRRQLDGKMYDNNQELYYFLVESNVGINKTNRLVERQVNINIDENQQKLSIKFQNNNQLPYINYQRLYIKPNNNLVSVLIDDQEITQIDQRVMETKDGQKWREVGFLAPVLAKGQNKIEINLKSELGVEEQKSIFIQKQSGLQATTYSVNYQDQSKNFELTSDQSLIFD
ncbi:DUF4012 domain-containing protein [Patescibacteria group bacterium]|nr:DUF4012 domain-containing protein [Patescibacteria group bacterium]